ncbi:MAG: branched-chain amino acid transport system II carrier protein, partial [Firmicutes bacterium]|nr:branched-chain amino acid transport system II carrier protein [Bacillota bacterium]
ISVTAFTWAAALFDFIKTLPEALQSSLHLQTLVDFARKILLWFDLNLGWVVPALVGLILGLIIRQIKKGRPAAAAAK